MPHLGLLDEVAFFLFQKTRWDFVGDAMTGQRISHLNYPSLELAARSHGIELTGELFDRVQGCEAWMVEQDREKAKRAAEAAKNRTSPDRPEPVN